MASEWFYARDGQKHGPYSSPQLRAMAQSGELLRTDLIWKNGMAEWRPAGETTQLFAGVREDGKTQSKSKVPVAESGSAEATVPQPKGFKATAQAAARATQLAAERTKLTTITLPAAYLELGKHCYESRAIASDFPKEMTNLDEVEKRLSAEAESTTPTSTSSWSDRAKAVAGKGLEFAQKQKAALEKAAALRRLGKLAYEKYGSDAGPDAVVHPIATALARLAEIESLLGGTDSERRRWRLWHVAAAIMGVSFAVGAVKELMSDKTTTAVPSVSVNRESSQRGVQAATASKPDAPNPPSQSHEAPRTSGASRSPPPAVMALGAGDSKPPAVANADEVAAHASNSKLSPTRIRIFTTSAPPRAVTQIIIDSNNENTLTGFATLFPICATLRHLSLNFDTAGDMTPSEFDLGVLRTCRDLEVLDLGTQYGLVPEDFSGLASQFPALKALRCCILPKNNAEWSSGIRLAAICTELAKLKRLKVLSLSLARGHNGQDYVKYLSQCTALEYLDVEGANILELAAVARQLRQLKTLELPRHSMNSPPPKGENVVWIGESYNWIRKDKDVAAFLAVAGKLQRVSKVGLEYSPEDPDLVEKLKKALPKTEVSASEIKEGRWKPRSLKPSWREYVAEIDQGQESLVWVSGANRRRRVSNEGGK
jgi:hypothetical protein